jgi:hypothetical protein
MISLRHNTSSNITAHTQDLTLPQYVALSTFKGVDVIDAMLQQMNLRYRQKEEEHTDLVLFSATHQKWADIKALLAERLVSSKHLSTLWQFGDDKGANTLWILMYDQQWEIINLCLLQNLITVEQLASQWKHLNFFDLLDKAPASVKENFKFSYQLFFQRALDDQNYVAFETVLCHVSNQLPFMILMKIINLMLNSQWKDSSFECNLKKVLKFCRDHSVENGASIDAKQSFVKITIFSQLQQITEQDALTKAFCFINNSSDIQSVFTNASCYGLFTNTKPWERLLSDTNELFSKKMFELEKIKPVI